jgi:glycosyltransferase involved in cell wall biosynthesis
VETKGKKVLHINEISNVAGILCKGLNEIGYKAELFKLASGKGISRPKLALLRLTEFLRLIKKARAADIVHIHYGFFGIYGILCGVPYYLHLHGSDVRQNLKAPFLGALTKLAILKAKGVFYSTPDLEEEVTRLRTDAVFLPNPIRTDEFVPGSVDTSNHIRVLSISRLNHNKGIDKVFSALKKVKQTTVNVEIHAMGCGIHKDLYINKSFIDKYLEDVPYNQMCQLLGSYNLLIGQMSVGAIGMTELEGLATERPVLANFKYGHIYSELPPLLSVNDEDELYACILELINDKCKRDMIGRKGREWVINQHNYCAVAKKLSGYYEME